MILDVRRDQEWAASHIVGAVHIPVHQLPSHLADVPEGEVWVHCEAGCRASIAASILDAAGRAVVAVDDDYARAAPILARDERDGSNLAAAAVSAEAGVQRLSRENRRTYVQPCRLPSL